MLCAKGLSVEFGLGVMYVVFRFTIWKSGVGVSVTGIFPSAPVLSLIASGKRTPLQYGGSRARSVERVPQSWG